MAIDATHILQLVQQKIAAANSSTSTADLDKLLTLTKQVDGSLVRAYDSDGALPDADLTNEKIAYITSTGNIKFNNGRWDAASVAAVDEADPWVFQGTVSGYSSGGNLNATPTNTIDKFPFASDANATDVGDLAHLSIRPAGQSSAQYGYTSGSRNPSPSTPFALKAAIDKFPFASDANATNVGVITLSQELASGQSSAENGYTSGGEHSGNTVINTIDKFPFAADADATDVADLTQARKEVTGQSSDTSGYSSGGEAPPGRQNIIDKFPFASDANATDVGDLTQSRNGPGGQSSSTHGYSSGGESPPVVNTIDKFSFAADGNATDVGNLATSLRNAAGQSSTTDGYNSGGLSTGGPENFIQKFSFATDTNASDIADLTQGRIHPAGQQV
jgi:hypothetical protein